MSAAPVPQLANTATVAKSGIFSKIIAGLGKFDSFIVKIFTEAESVDATWQKLAPQTKAALLATFYDTVKTVQSGEATVAAGGAGNFPLAVTLGAQTATLVRGVVNDAKTDLSVIKQDLTALGL